MNNENTNPVWNNSGIQFPRLLAEILAVGLTPKQYQDLGRSMDLDIDDIDELFERADRLFAIEKALTLDSGCAAVQCPAIGCDTMHAEIFHHDDLHTHLRCCGCDCRFEINYNGIVKG